jgi:hypothetical protein
MLSLLWESCEKPSASAAVGSCVCSRLACVATGVSPLCPLCPTTTVFHLLGLPRVRQWEPTAAGSMPRSDHATCAKGTAARAGSRASRHQRHLHGTHRKHPPTKSKMSLTRNARLSLLLCVCCVVRKDEFSSSGHKPDLIGWPRRTQLRQSQRELATRRTRDGGARAKGEVPHQAL